MLSVPGHGGLDRDRFGVWDDGIVGLGFVLWERYESQRLARERLRRRIPRHRQPSAIRSVRRAA